MRILILGDMDDLIWRGETGQADLVVSVGDISEGLIMEAAAAHACTTIFAVKGNHDLPAPFQKGITDLHLNCAKLCGLTFGGLRGAWKYKPKGHFLYDQEEAERMLAEFPPVDVLISHNSPLGIHDRPDGIHTGFSGLLNYVERQEPRVHIHGHQHQNIETMVGKTRVLGVYGYRVLEMGC